MRRTSLLLLCLLSLAPRAASADSSIDWSPTRTWVFAVGLLEWQHSDIYGSFPECKPNRRDEQLVRFFHDAGVPDRQSVYLQDAQATKARIEQRFRQLLDETRAGDLLIFYFCGHGSRDVKSGRTCFANYDAGDDDDSAWDVKSIFSAIEHHFHGDRALLMADCCHSGALYDLAQQHRQSKIAFAVLTSSYSHNSSTGRWTFSDVLLAGLRGEPGVDADGDRTISLQELAAYGHSEMAFAEGQKSMFLAAEHFPRRTKLSQVHGSHKPRVGQRLEVNWKGKWYKAKVIDTDGPRLKIHYLNYESSWDEWVGLDRIRPYQPPQFAPGDQVEVLWKDDKWYRAVVREGSYGLHLVRYDGYDSSWDEWIGPDNIRIPLE